MMTRFAKSQEVARALAERSADFLAGNVNTSGFGANALPFVVFNTSGHERSAVVKTVVDIERFYFEPGNDPHECYEAFVQSIQKRESLSVVDSEGEEVEAVIRPLGIEFGYQLPEDRFRQPYWAYQVEIELYADSVPGLGHRTFALVQKEASARYSPELAADRKMENEFVRVWINDDGSFDVLDKANGASYKEMGIYEDTGDIGNEYMYKQPDGEAPLTTRGLKASIALVQNSSLSAVYRIEHSWPLPLGTEQTLDDEMKAMVPFRFRKAQRVKETVEVKIVTELTLEKSSRSVSMASTIDNTIEDHRVRILFPTGLQTDVVTVDSIYELASRKIKPEAEWINPSNAQHQNAFVSISDGTAGVTVANIGLNEYEILQTDGTLAVTLLRGVRELGDWGVFPTPEAQCKGKHTFRLNLIFHDQDVVAYDAYVKAYQFPVPWTIRQTGIHSGSVPADHEALSWKGEKLAFSALKMGEENNDLYLRVFNVSHESTTLIAIPVFEVDGVYESTILETKGHFVAPRADGSYAISVGQAKIETIGINCSAVMKQRYPV